jgi:hypothetical protein
MIILVLLWGQICLDRQFLLLIQNHQLYELVWNELSEKLFDNQFTQKMIEKLFMQIEEILKLFIKTEKKKIMN